MTRSDTLEAVATPASDEAYLATPFVQQLIKQLRAQDINGTWDSKSDLQLLKPYIHTAEERRACPFWVTLIRNRCGIWNFSTTRLRWRLSAKPARWCRQ